MDDKKINIDDLDDMLSFICKQGKINYDDISCEYDKKSVISELESKGLVERDSIYVMGGSIFWILPTDDGKEFYRKGGFKGELERKEEDKRRFEITDKRSRRAFIISIIAIIVTLLIPLIEHLLK